LKGFNARPLIAFVAIAAVVAYAYTTRERRDAKPLHARELAVEVVGDVRGEPKDNGIPSVHLAWPAEGRNVTCVRVLRRVMGRVTDDQAPWEKLLDVTDARRSSFDDTTVQRGNVYEYRVERDHTGAPFASFGLVAVAVHAEAVLSRGRVLVLVESTLEPSLGDKVDRLLDDLTADGWAPSIARARRDEPEADVAARVKVFVDADVAGARAVFAIGHVPLRIGALPGQTLGVGRVDFDGLPALAPVPAALRASAYLDKDHAFRAGEIEAAPRVLVDDALGYSMRADGKARYPYAANAYRAGAALFGENASREAKLFDPGQAPALFAYGGAECNGARCEGLGAAKDFVERPPNAMFLLLYAGNGDDFLRASIASPTSGLAALSVVSDLDLHALAVDQPLAQIRAEIVGDPTLRVAPGSPPRDVHATLEGDRVAINWTAPPGDVLGYRVGRALNRWGGYQPLGDLVVGTRFVDEAPVRGELRYAIRAVRRVRGASGVLDVASTGAATLINAP
jgi:hypothetical protein